MRHTLRQNTIFTRIEFWAAATIFVFILFFFIVDGFDVNSAPFTPRFEEAGISFNFYKNYYIPQLIRNVALFLAFLYLNFIVVPKLISRQRVVLHIVLLVFTFLIMGAIFGITDTYLRAYLYDSSKGNVTEMMLRQGLDDAFILLAVFTIYTIIKYLSLYVIAVSPAIEFKYRFIRREGVVATIIWIIVLLVFLIGEVPRLLIAGWIIAIPSAIILYLLGFYSLIPSSLNKKYSFVSYALKNALILFLILMAWGLILKIVVGGDQAHLAALWVFNSVLQMFITIPITWILYKRHMKGNEQLNFLKKELNQSNASFDFLRSQINPHFLFNALNTIYGTALQEGADRTSEAIQKLGDMMRFMLQENMQDKISLMREIEYLNNYIDLQKLRTATHPDIKIHTEIKPALTAIQVAPMLFIPFVENAFKHGISFREPSYISIMLEISEGTVNFNVRNSRHPRQANDPEADKSGIGLVNVKQRLELLYPGKHELVIREAANEFFVHLSIQTS